MEKPIFDLLIEISRKDFVDFKDISGVSNRTQMIYESEKLRKLDYLENNGFVSRTKDIYIATEYGYIVAQYENWSEYLEHQKELVNRKIAKENNDLKISEFQVRTTYLPYLLSGISFFFSVYVFFNTRTNNEDYVSKNKNEPIKQLKIISKNKQKQTTLPLKAIDSAKPKSLTKP